MGKLFLFYALFGAAMGVLGSIASRIVDARPTICIAGKPFSTELLLEIPILAVVAAVLIFVMKPLQNGMEIALWRHVLLIVTAMAACAVVILLASLIFPKKKRAVTDEIQEGEMR